MAAALLAAILAWGVPALPSGAAESGYRALGPVLVSRPLGYDYAYAPSLVREDGLWHAFYCSTGDGRAWDFVRHATSPDGRRWSPPEIVLKGAASGGERAACDPSVVRYRARGDERPFFYMFYSGAPLGLGTAMFVARADRIEGPYAKWTAAGWTQAPEAEASPILRPAVPHGDGQGFYGAGQQSVVVRDGRLQAWFTDDTTCPERACARIFEARTDDPTNWPERRPTGVAASSVDVKYDSRDASLVMLAIGEPHTFSSFLVRYVSRDGVAWGRPDIVVPPTAFTHYAHNVGVGGDAEGHALPGDALIMFGAPSGPACGSCWAHWDLAAGLLPESIFHGRKAAPP